MEKLKIVKEKLTFSEALQALKNFKLIKCPEWQGYWFLEAGMIHVKKHNGVVTNTPWLESTILREDWQIVEVDLTDLFKSMYEQPMQIIERGIPVMDNSNAFHDWLKLQEIDFKCTGHQTEILGNRDMFEIGMSWGTFKTNHQTASMHKEPKIK